MVHRKRWRLRSATLLVAVIALAAVGPPAPAGGVPTAPLVEAPCRAPAPELDDLVIRFLDVGQSDATLLQAPDAAVLVDAGHWQRNDVVPYLATYGVEELDLLVITHPHADHLGQFAAVMEAVTVREVWWSGSTATTNTFVSALDALEAWLDRTDGVFEEPQAGDTAQIGSLYFEVVNPPDGSSGEHLNNASLAARITYGDVRILFTGDVESPKEEQMVASYAHLLDADIYQAGHHGSGTSTTQALVDAVTPSVAVYSTALGNPYGHPSPEVVARLEGSGVAVYGTDIHGTVTITTNGSTFEVSVEHEEERTPCLSARWSRGAWAIRRTFAAAAPSAAPRYNRLTICRHGFAGPQGFGCSLSGAKPIAR